jgi:hypothetical protein
VHPLERPELPLEIKAALFAQLLAGEEEKGRKVCVCVCVCVCEQVCVREQVCLFVYLSARMLVHVWV